MKIGLISNSILSSPAAELLHQAGLLCGLAAPAINASLCTSWRNEAEHLCLPFVAVQKQSQEDLLMHWIDRCQPDLVMVMTYPYLIPSSLLSLPRMGFLNFHPGPLPSFRGPDPIFWQIKRGVSDSCITVHRMDSTYDTGPVVSTIPLTIEPHATYRMVMNTFFDNLAAALPELIRRVHLPELPVIPQPAQSSNFDPVPSFEHLLIDWDTMSAEQIVNLIRASNPDRGGASTLFRGVPVQFLEASTSQLEKVPMLPPGTVVSSNTGRGLQILAARGECIACNVLATDEGLFSGDHFCRLFKVQIGDRFESLTLQSGNSVSYRLSLSERTILV